MLFDTVCSVESGRGGINTYRESKRFCRYLLSVKDIVIISYASYRPFEIAHGHLVSWLQSQSA